MHHPLKVTSTLADETRFSIYEYMLQHKRYFSVQEIAEQFTIHSNVARLHLTKLSEIGVISAEYLKTGKGGRPGRVYRAKQEGIHLSFPKRDHSLLVQWSIELIHELGDEALQKAIQISYKDGENSIQQLLNDRKKMHPLSFEEKLKILTQSASLIGYITEVLDDKHSKTITFSIFNCPFHDQMPQYGEIICQLHESYLLGQVEQLFDTNDFVQIETMLRGCDFCKYKIAVFD